MAVGFVILGDVERPPRIAMMGCDGGLLIVDITDYDVLHIGTWTVVADLGGSRIQGIHDQSSKEIIYPHFIPPDYTRMGKTDVQRRRDGILIACGDYFVVIAKDGSAKYFNSECAIGAGDSCGQNLRVRKPYSGGSLQAPNRKDSSSREDSSADDIVIKPIRTAARLVGSREFIEYYF
jgi:hypothetical protein